MLRENWYNVHNVCKWLCWISEKIVMFVFFHHILQLSTLNGYLRVMFASLRLVFAIENWYNVHNVCKWLCWISEKIVMFVFFHHILQLSTLNGYLRVMFASLRLVFAIELVSTRIFSSVKAFFSHKCKDISFLQREQNSNFGKILRKLENNRVVSV